MRTTIAALLMAVTALAGCKAANSPDNAAAAVDAAASNRSEGDELVNVAEDDPKMNAAKQQGRATLPQFLAKLQKPAADERDFSIKFNLVPNGTAEFIWTNDLKRENGKLSGALANNPHAQGYAIGQRVAIPEADIIDWGYYKGDVMQGHYSTRVLLASLSPEEASQIRTAFGWK